MILRVGMALSAVAAVLLAITIAVVATRNAPEGVAAPAEKTDAEQQPLQRSYRDRSEPPIEEPPPVVEQTPAAGQATPLPAGNPGWPKPEKGELKETRTFAPDPGSAMTLTLPSIGIYDAPIFDSDSSAALDNGVAHVPETSMPWDRGTQKNTYLAAHRLGYPGTGSRLLFYNLDSLKRGDEVIIEGRGRTYRYRVTEMMVVDPSDRWVMGEVRGRDMVTLQTCTPIPTFEKRLVVRADKIQGSGSFG